MTADNWIDLVTAVSGFVAAIAWPAALVYLVVRFRNPIGDFFNTLNEFSLKAGGIEATGKRRQRAAAALDAAIASRGLDQRSESDPLDTPTAVWTLDRALPDARSYRSVEGSRVLWVDDRPDNNVFERQSLEALGITFSLSTSTDDALRLLGAGTYDLVISDMGRPPDDRAGYTLLDQIRASGDPTPFVIYASSRSAEHVAEARRRGAIGCTNSPSELVSMVTSVLTSTGWQPRHVR